MSDEAARIEKVIIYIVDFGLEHSIDLKFYITPIEFVILGSEIYYCGNLIFF